MHADAESLGHVQNNPFCWHSVRAKKCVWGRPRVASERERAGLSVRSEWALSLVRWVEHMRRHPATPASFLITVQDDLWIQTVRALNMRAMSFEGFLAGATSTRSGPGKTNSVGRWLVIRVGSRVGRGQLDQAKEFDEAEGGICAKASLVMSVLCFLCRMARSV